MFFTRKTLLYVFVMAICVHAIAQDCTYKFSGIVTDENENALVGAYILIHPGTGAVTDINGVFSVLNLCKRKYHVEVSYLGYEGVQFDLLVDGNVEQDIRLKEARKQLDEIVVKEEAAHIENAINYSRLSQQKLEELAGKSLGETLREVTGISTIQAGPGIFKPVIHGVHSQRVLILNHGIRQEGQQWGAEHAPEIDPFMASNIVVVKDAAAIKYGSDALGGVVVVNPPELPTEAGIGGSLHTIATSNGRSGTLSGMLEGGVKSLNGWGWRLQGTAKRAGDYNTPTYQLTNTGMSEYDFSASTGYHGDKMGFEVFFSHFETELGILRGTAIGNTDDLEAAMEREPPQGTMPFSYSISEPRQEVEHNLLKVNAHMEGKSGEWRLQYGFQNNARKEFDIRIGGLSSIPAIDLKLNTHTTELEWESTKVKSGSLCFGVNTMFQNNNNLFGIQRIPFIPNYASTTIGLFGVSNFKVRQWKIDMGARYDYRYYSVKGYDFKNASYEGDFQFSNVSAMLGALRQWKSNQSFSSSLSTAWRPPHVAELYSLGTHQSAAAIEYGFLLNDSTNEVMNIEDVNFKVEKAVKWVNTYKRKWAYVELEASVYGNYIFNYIFLKPIGVTQNLRGTYPYFRYAQTNAFFTGLDFEGLVSLSSHLRLETKATLLRASDDSNKDYLISIPSNQYSLGLRLDGHGKLGVNGFYAVARVRYVDKQRRAPRVITVKEFNDAQENNTDALQGSEDIFDFMDTPDGYALVNAAIGFSIGKKVKYDFRLSVDNLLDTSYREYTNRFRYYSDDIGRNVIASIKCVF